MTNTRSRTERQPIDIGHLLILFTLHINWLEIRKLEASTKVPVSIFRFHHDVHLTHSVQTHLLMWTIRDQCTWKDFT
jgi:hypothetical protein